MTEPKSGDKPVVTLLPCPFCGHAVIGMARAHDTGWWAECNRCGASKLPAASEREAIAAWNTRHHEQETLSSEREALLEALVQHNERLRSAVAIADREGADTNWIAFRGQCRYTLAEYHDIVNEARAVVADALSTPPAPEQPDLGEVERLREALAEAYRKGATDVHAHWQNNPGEAPRGDPEFGEAASDYASAAFDIYDSSARAALTKYRNHQQGDGT